MLDIVTIGDALMDIFLVLDESDANCVINKKSKKLCFEYADKICIQHSTHAVGGNAANVAIGTKKLGLDSAIMTELGDDINGQVVFNKFKERGVDTRMIKIHKGKETRYSVVLNYDAERTILSYHVPRKYKLAKIPATKLIYYTSLGKSFEGLQNKLVDYLKKHKSTKLAINPGSYQFRNGLKKIKEIIPMADILIVNKEEAGKLLGKKAQSKQCAKALNKMGAKIAVVTDGMDGSYASDGINLWHLKPYPIKPVAKTGAGDAYTSGFLSAIIAGKDIQEAMQWGTANAGSTVLQFGAQKGLASRAGVRKIIQKYKNNKPKKLT